MSKAEKLLLVDELLSKAGSLLQEIGYGEHSTLVVGVREVRTSVEVQRQIASAVTLTREERLVRLLDACFADIE